MEIPHSWHSLFPISSSQAIPPMLKSPLLGPLFFNPLPETLKVLLSSLSFLSPPLLPPPPSNSLPRFIASSTFYNSPVLPSTSVTIGASFSNSLYRLKDTVLHNRLEPLKFPGNKILVFFPTGDNLSRVGFLVLKVKDSNLVVDSTFSSDLPFNHRIVRLSACPIKDWVLDSSGSAIVGFLLACSSYAVHWFAVRIKGYNSGSGSGSPALIYIGTKWFKTCAVAHACWNPHMREECLVLLKSGELFLFNMHSPCLNHAFRGKRISISRNEMKEWKDSEWFSCEFSSHPRILILANSKAVYIVDLRFGQCQVDCLISIESLDMDELAGEDQFVALSMVGEDGFFYSVASKQWLLLCDVRKPFMPVLRWAHNVHEPCYMTSLPLNVLRSQPSDDGHKRVSDMGSAIILGSFWNNEFSIFCYGRSPQGTVPATSGKISELADAFYAWKLPSQLPLFEQKCLCGTCNLMEEFAKEDLPEWIKWQQKKELLLGFFILDKELSSFLPKPGKNGGFTLIRLLSSGKLESQQYSASQKLMVCKRDHGETEKYLKDSLLCTLGDDTYIINKFVFLRPEDLYCHLNNNLAKVLFSKSKRAIEMASEERFPNERFVNFMSEKLKSFGCKPPISDLSVSDIFRDVAMPTSLFELVYRVMWMKLPMDILEMTFTIYTEVNLIPTYDKKAIIEFPTIKEKEQSPLFFFKCPSYRSNKWSTKTQPCAEFVGPVLPLPAALIAYGISKYGYSYAEKIDEFSLEKEFSLQCKSITCLAKEMGNLYCSGEEDKEYAVSLKDDNEEMCVGSSNPSRVFLYQPSACPDEVSCDIMEETEDLFLESERFELFVANLSGNDRIDEDRYVDAMEVLDDLSLVELNYNVPIQKYDPEMLREYELLKTDFSTWENSYIPYQNLRARLKPKEQIVKP